MIIAAFIACTLCDTDLRMNRPRQSRSVVAEYRREASLVPEVITTSYTHTIEVYGRTYPLADSDPQYIAYACTKSLVVYVSINAADQATIYTLTNLLALGGN